MFQFFIAGILSAQSASDTTVLPPADSLVQVPVINKDSTTVRPYRDSVSKRPVNDSSFTGLVDSPGFSWKRIEQHPYFGFGSRISEAPAPVIKQFHGKELMFYLMILLLVLFALLRQAFPKYFSDLFRLFFRTTIKQRQIKEQLMQTPLPSVLLNIFFFLSGGLYGCFVLEHFHLNPTGSFWLLYFYCIAGLSAIYFVKFIGLKITGWLTNMQEAADAYIFIVFIVNKMIGVLLLPFLVLVAFTVGDIYSASMTLSWCLVAGLLIYRFILTYTAVRNQVKVNPFHFFLYLCAFEIAPLLLIYRGLLLFFRITP